MEEFRKWRSSLKSEQNLKEICAHPKVMDDGNGVAFDYKQKSLRLSKDEITRLKNANSANLFGKKKLQLVLDLDHTLVHSKVSTKLTGEEKYLENQIDSVKDVGSLFKLKAGYIVKLRPFVRTFLEEVCRMFEMYIFTMGNRYYAKEVVPLLDPQGKYFSGRVTSRDDVNQNRKSLDLVLGMECGIIILDDSESVWYEKHRKNLIQMKNYTYFAENPNDKRSYSARKKDESESNGALAYMLIVLKAIHGLFFSPEIESLPCRDVAILLERLRGKVLRGCIIFYSEFDQFHDIASISSHATMLGAGVTDTLDSSVTHVVSSKKDTEASLWAQQKNKFLVLPRWVSTTYHLWHRQPEDNFLVLN